MPLVKTKFKTMYLVSSKPDNSTSTTVDTYREDDDNNNNNNNNNNNVSNNTVMQVITLPNSDNTYKLVALLN